MRRERSDHSLQATALVNEGVSSETQRKTPAKDTDMD